MYESIGKKGKLYANFKTVEYMNYPNFYFYLFHCPLIWFFASKSKNAFLKILFYLSANNHNAFMKTSLFFISIKLHLPKCLSTTLSYLSSFICFLFFTYSALNIKLIRVQFLPPFSYHSTNSPQAKILLPAYAALLMLRKTLLVHSLHISNAAFHTPATIHLYSQDSECDIW